MPIFQVEARIIKNLRIAKDIWEMNIHAPEIASAAYAGQFVMLRVRNEFFPLLRRPFSFSKLDPAEGNFAILYKVVGMGTGIMTGFKPDQSIDVLGPLGRGFSLPPENCRKIWLLAGGIGIAPFFELFSWLKQEKADLDITLFYGATTAEELIEADFFEKKGGRINVCTDDGTCGFRGFITDSIESTCTLTNSPDYFYACGPVPMQRKVIQWARCNNVPGQLSMETMMACGVGVCLGCSVPRSFFDTSCGAENRYLRVCSEGPVFKVGE